MSTFIFCQILVNLKIKIFTVGNVDTAPVKRIVKERLRQATEGDHSCVIVHIDTDCFYAQVEMIRDPSLKDKPLGMTLS